MVPFFDLMSRYFWWICGEGWLGVSQKQKQWRINKSKTQISNEQLRPFFVHEQFILPVVCVRCFKRHGCDFPRRVVLIDVVRPPPVTFTIRRYHRPGLMRLGGSRSQKVAEGVWECEGGSLNLSIDNDSFAFEGVT